jgi:cytochrome c biogenesis protein CcdA
VLPAFFEAIRATTQPCTLLLLLAPVVMAIVTRGRWSAFVATCVGAVLGGWLFIANVVALDGWLLQVSGALVVAALGVAIAAPSVARLRWADNYEVQAAAAGLVTFTATLWWRPCIGEELGAILTGARRGVLGELPGITAYMIGAMMPVLAVGLAVRAIDPSVAAERRFGWLAGGIGMVAAAAVAIGRHDELVTTLTRWTTS